MKKEELNMSLEALLETNMFIQGTYDEDILSKFLEKHRNKLNQHGNYSIFLFIDKESCELDIKEWRSFNYTWETFQSAKALCLRAYRYSARFAAKQKVPETDPVPKLLERVLSSLSYPFPCLRLVGLLAHCPVS